MTRLFKCPNCQRYTLEERRCPVCGEMPRDPHPPKYSPQDKYGKYRRQAKRKVRISEEKND